MKHGMMEYAEDANAMQANLQRIVQVIWLLNMLNIHFYSILRQATTCLLFCTKV